MRYIKFMITFTDLLQIIAAFIGFLFLGLPNFQESFLQGLIFGIIGGDIGWKIGAFPGWIERKMMRRRYAKYSPEELHQMIEQFHLDFSPNYIIYEFQCRDEPYMHHIDTILSHMKSEDTTQRSFGYAAFKTGWPHLNRYLEHYNPNQPQENCIQEVEKLEKYIISRPKGIVFFENYIQLLFKINKNTAPLRNDIARIKSCIPKTNLFRKIMAYIRKKTINPKSGNFLTAFSGFIFLGIHVSEISFPDLLLAGIIGGYVGWKFGGIPGWIKRKIIHLRSAKYSTGELHEKIKQFDCKCPPDWAVYELHLRREICFQHINAILSYMKSDNTAYRSHGYAALYIGWSCLYKNFDLFNPYQPQEICIQKVEQLEKYIALLQNDIVRMETLLFSSSSENIDKNDITI